jgi:hypothetical protein
MRHTVMGIVCMAAACAMAVGCRAPAAGSRAPTADAVSREVTFTLGVVRQVRSAMGYVVLECVSLPLQGERVTVYRHGVPAAHLQVNGPVRMPYAAADILDGNPEVGDKVKTARMKTAAVERGRQ